MSLINDALKQARQKVEKPGHSPVEGLSFRPAEPLPPSQKKTWLIPAVIGVTLTLVAIAGMGFYQNRNARSSKTPSESTTVKARSNDSSATVASVEVGKAQPPVAPKAAERPAPSPAKPAVVANPAPAVTNLSPAAADAKAPVAPPPQPLRLQAIVYNPSQPSALISGKSVFVGERVQGMKVVSITKDSATLTANGKNTVLTLPE